jgi:hypothetical protein
VDTTFRLLSGCEGGAAVEVDISSNTVTKLPLHDQRCLDAAEGWLALGNHLAAKEDQA